MNKRPSSGKKDSFKSNREKGSAAGGKRNSAAGGDRPFSKRSDDKKPFDRTARDKKDDGKPNRPKYNADGGGSRPFSKRSDDRKERPARDRDDDTRSYKPRGEGAGDRPYAKRDDDRKSSDRPARFKKDDGKTYKPNTFESEQPFPKRKDDKRVFDQPKREDGRLAKRNAGTGDKPYAKRDDDRKSFEKTGRIKKDEPRSYKPNTFESSGDQAFDDSGNDRKTFDRPARDNKEGGKPFTKRSDDKKSFDRPARDNKEGGKPFAKRNDDKKSFDRPARDKKEDTRPFRSRNESAGGKPFAKRSDDKKPFDRAAKGKSDSTGDRKAGKKPFEKKTEGRIVKKTYGPQGSYGEDKPERDPKKGSFARSVDYKNRPDRPDRPQPDGPKLPKAPRREKDEEVVEVEKEKIAFKTPHKHKTVDREISPRNPRSEQPEGLTPGGKPKRKRKHVEEDDEEEDVDTNTQMTLNKYIAHSGECGRREAAELVKQGKVKVNGELVTDPGYRVQDTDKITLVGKKLQPIKDFAYVLLNKPKGFITTTEDPQERKTVMDLVDNSGVDRLYPIGRLDRNTSGLLLLTNDGDLAQKLSHPAYTIKKVYQVTLDKNLTKADFEKVAAGVQLEDGIAQVDELAYLESKNEIGLEIHSGRNRIVRRIFESMGYVVEKLDRVMYAGLTKKNLPRGKWRFLNDQEIILIKHFKS